METDEELFGRLKPLEVKDGEPVEVVEPCGVGSNINVGSSRHRSVVPGTTLGAEGGSLRTLAVLLPIPEDEEEVEETVVAIDVTLEGVDVVVDDAVVIAPATVEAGTPAVVTALVLANEPAEDDTPVVVLVVLGVPVVTLDPVVVNAELGGAVPELTGGLLLLLTSFFKNDEAVDGRTDLVDDAVVVVLAGFV